MRILLTASAAVLAGSLTLTGCGSSGSTGTDAVASPTDSGAVAAAADLPTTPAADHAQKGFYWYEGSPPILRATSGAPIEGQSDYVVTYDDDGVKGMIRNGSGHDVLVQTKFESRPEAKAILKPGDQLPYKLYGTGVLEFTKMVDGVVLYDTTSKLLLKDPAIGYPKTEFTPPGRSSPANVRTGWREQTTHEDIWGSIRIRATREKDGWTIPASSEFLSMYRDPNSFGPEDWAVFTITIFSL